MTTATTKEDPLTAGLNPFPVLATNRFLTFVPSSTFLLVDVEGRTSIDAILSIDMTCDVTILVAKSASSLLTMSCLRLGGIVEMGGSALTADATSVTSSVMKMLTMETEGGERVSMNGAQTRKAFPRTSSIDIRVVLVAI